MRTVVLGLVLAVSSGCATNVGTGLIAGTVLGAGSGSLGGGSAGALIGTAAGLVGGALIGFALDEQDRQVMEKSSPRTVDRMERSEPLTMNDVIKLSQSGVADETILQYMKESGSSYTLSQAQIRRLQDGGVSERVVNYMINSGR